MTNRSRSAHVKNSIMDWNTIQFPPHPMRPSTFTPIYLTQDFQADPYLAGVMTQRVLRFPPHNARLIRLEEGPPMYRMLGYADRNNRCPDLCFPDACGLVGPFATPRLPSNRTVSVGPGRFGLPMSKLPFTTYYWDDAAFPRHHYVNGRTINRMYFVPLETRPEAACFPERAVPGSGVNSKCADSACLCYTGSLPLKYKLC